MAEQSLLPDSEGRWSCRLASKADIDFCVRLEEQLKPDAEHAKTNGFLLSGTTHADFASFLQQSVWYIATIDNEAVGFLLALEREHPRIRGLFDKLQQFQVTEPEPFALLNLFWIAKIAIMPRYARCGIGTGLYELLFKTYPTYNFMTATLMAPLRNVPSESFHSRMGFRKIGEFMQGDRGALKNCVSALVFRAATKE